MSLIHITTDKVALLPVMLGVGAIVRKFQIYSERFQACILWGRLVKKE